MESLWQDVKFGIRMLFKRPDLTFGAVLTLALGIGANSAIFSVVHGVLLKPLPYPEPERLALVWTRWSEFGTGWISVPEYFDVVDRNRVFDSLGLFQTRNYNFDAGFGEPESIVGAVVTPSAFDVLGVPPAHGRLFSPEEGVAVTRLAPDAEPEDAPAEQEVEEPPLSVVLSHELWQRRFGGDVGVLEKSYTASGRSFFVAGILPAGFQFPGAEAAEVFVSLRVDPGDVRRGSHSFRMLARLGDGVGHAAAATELDRLGALMRQEHSEQYPDEGFTLWVQPLAEYLVGGIRGNLLLLFGVVGCVLLIACANVANLLLARATGREREMAVRAALGGGRSQLVSQLLVESVMLALCGGLAAVGVAAGSLKALFALEPGHLPRMDEVRLDPTALGYTLLLAVVTGLVFGLAPVLYTRRLDLFHALRERGTGDVERGRLRDVLVGVEVAVATVLLIFAGLLTRSFLHLQQTDLGFDYERVITAHVTLADARYGERERRVDFFRRLTESLAAVPGIESGAAGTYPPLCGSRTDMSIGVEGYDPPSATPLFEQVRRVTPGYFETLGIPLLRGRPFAASESEPVVIVSKAFAEEFFHGEDPVGQRMKLGSLDSDNKWLTVVGMVGDVRHDGPQAPPLRMYYLPHEHSGAGSLTVVVRSELPVATVHDLIREQVREIDPSQAVHDLRAYRDFLGDRTARFHFILLLLGTFAVLAVALAAVGIYGVVSYVVGSRSREIGLRMAIGARGNDVVRFVVRQGMTSVLIGLIVGVASAAVLTRLLDRLLFGVSATDPGIFATYSVVLITVALVACSIPAHRATRVDPVVALRDE